MPTNPPAPRLTNEQLAACASTLALMRQLGPEHFDMDHWFVDLPGVDESTTDGSICSPGNPCGTAACLAGTAIWANKIPTVPSDLDTPWWRREDAMKDRVRDTLGMNAGYAQHGAREELTWFNVGRWPRFAQREYDRRWDALIDKLPDDASTDIDDPSNAAARHRVEWEVVEWILDCLVHGTKLHWWDDTVPMLTEDGVL